MKRILFTVLVIGVFFCTDAFSQSGNSNIGTEFWTAWMDHIDPSTGSNACQMNLYIACDVPTTVTVSLADNSFTNTYNVVPNLITIVAIPTTAFLGNTNGTQNKGIHIVSKNPIAVYAHIYASSVSGATLLLPVNTLANDYYSLNYTQLSNSTPSYSLFMVVGTVDNTTVQITPSAALIDGSAANKPFNITLNKGQVYQGISTTDLSGTRIISVSSGNTGCQKIAVFSGSNKIYIGSPKQTSDNLFQQVYPTASWGKNYVTVPLKDRNYDVMRIVLSDPNTNVTLNGAIIPLNKFVNNFYYEFKTQTTNVISSDKPIQVIQYAVTQGNNFNGTSNTELYGDPEMIFLNPLEQNIDHVTLYSANEYLIKKSYINVVIPTSAASSFLLDGLPTIGSFVPVSGIAGYSSAQFTVTSGATHVIKASQGFNAIAYGFGSAESYGYAAGTNVKNLNEYVQQVNPVNGQVYSAGCTGIAFTPEVVIPYPTSSITWDLGNGTAPVIQANPVYKDTIHRNNTVLYVYDYGTPVSYSTAGIYSIKVTVIDPITTVCGSNEEIDLNYNVSNIPGAMFTSRDSVCLKDTVGFFDKTNANGNVISAWRWSFGTGDTSLVQNPVYAYKTPGDYTVMLNATNSTGCASVFTKTVHVRKLPVPAFSFVTPDCSNTAVVFNDQSATPEGKIIKWIWSYGDGSKNDTLNNNNPVSHAFARPGIDTVKLTVFTDKGCSGATISKPITIHPLPKVDFSLPDVCLANAVAQFTDKTTIADSSMSSFKYFWNFGDSNASALNPNTAVIKTPSHQFTQPGTYPVSLTVTSKDSCTYTVIKNFTVNGIANFTSDTVSCPGLPVKFIDKTDTTGKLLYGYHWAFGTKDTSLLQNPVYAYAQPGDYTAVLTVTGHNGCSTTRFSKKIHISQYPTAAFSYTSPDCSSNVVTFTDHSVAPDGKIIRWVWSYGDGSKNDTLANNNPVAHTFIQPGIDTVKLQILTDKGCNSLTASKTIIIHPLPIVDFTLPDVCLVNAVAQFTDKTTIADSSSAKFKYLWTFGDVLASVANPNTSTLKSPSHRFTKAGTYHIALTVTSKDTCSFTVAKDFTVNGIASFTSDSLSCPGSLISFKDLTDTTGKLAYGYHWAFGNGDTSVVQNPVYAFKYPGDYSVVLTVTGHNGCSTTLFTKKIHISKIPVAAFSYTSPDCETHTLTFTDHSSTAEGKIVRWIWSYGDGSKNDTLLNNAAVTHNFAKAATDTVKLLINTDKGCYSVIKSQPIVIHPEPAVDFSLPDVCLINAAAQFTDKTTIADSSSSKFKYLWSFGDTYATVSNPNTSALKSPVHIFTRAGTYKISLTVTSKDTCSFTTVKNFFVNGIAKFASDSLACPGSPVSFVDKTDTTGKLLYGYHWDFGDKDTSALQSPVYSYPKSGDYTVTLKITGHNGCSTTQFGKKVHIYQIPVASFVFSKTDCATKAITFTDQSTTAEGKIVKWHWIFNDGKPDTITTSNAPVTHAFAIAGTYHVSLIVTTNLGCTSDAATLPVLVNPLPTVDFKLPDVCEHDSFAQFTSTTTVANGSTLQYAWNFGDPGNPSSPNTATGLTVRHSYPHKGIYYVTLTVTTSDGCVADTVKQLTVNGSFPQAAFTVQNVSDLCSNQAVVFNNFSSNPGFNNGNVTSVTMFYDYINHPTDSVKYEPPGSYFIHSYPVSYTASKTYKVHMVAYSGASCFNSKDTVITLLPVPQITFSQIAPLCQNAGPVQLSNYVYEPAAYPAGTPTFLIDNQLSASGMFNPATAGAGLHNIKCIYIANATQCADTLSQTVDVEPGAIVTIGTNPPILAGGSTTLKATASGSNLVYNWTPSTGLSRTDILNPVASPVTDTRYLLTVVSTTNNVTCTVTDTLLLKVLQAPVIPTAFTPNGDGLNDTWVIQYIDSYPGCTVDVFNRNGEKVFSSVGYGTAWDGRYNGRPLPAGTYYYIIDPKHGRNKQSGSVTIIR